VLKASERWLAKSAAGGEKWKDDARKEDKQGGQARRRTTTAMTRRRVAPPPPPLAQPLPQAAALEQWQQWQQWQQHGIAACSRAGQQQQLTVERHF